MNLLAEHMQKYFFQQIKSGSYIIISPQLPYEEVVKIEKQLGLNIPSLLVDFYTKVSNGIIVGDAWVMCLISQEGDISTSVLSVYNEFHCSKINNLLWKWPDGLMPFCDWGGGIYSCVDTNDPEYKVFAFDANVQVWHQPKQACIMLHKNSLYVWMIDLLAGINMFDEIARLERPASIQLPFEYPVDPGGY